MGRNAATRVGAGGAFGGGAGRRRQDHSRALRDSTVGAAGVERADEPRACRGERGRRARSRDGAVQSVEYETSSRGGIVRGESRRLDRARKHAIPLDIGIGRTCVRVRRQRPRSTMTEPEAQARERRRGSSEPGGALAVGGEPLSRPGLREVRTRPFDAPLLALRALKELPRELSSGIWRTSWG